MNVLCCPSGEQLERLLADQLDAAEFASISEHIDQCPSCRKALEEHLASVPVPAPAPVDLPRESAPDHSFLQELRALRPAGGLGAAAQVVPLANTPVHGISDTPGTPAPVPEALPERIGDYAILAELGRGGMAIVYKAQHTQLQRMVALKMIRRHELDQAEHRARFRAEAEAVAKLRHRNIVQVYEIGEHQGHPYLVLEFVEGGNLADYLGRTPEEPYAAAQFLERAAEAVHYAHQQGIVHRDLKPANILLQVSQRAGDKAGKESGRTLQFTFPKLTDFGLAKCLGEDSGLTRTDMLVGTPTHLAPEQIGAGPKSVTPACDIYALGVILYEMLTGVPPFVGPNVQATLWMVQHENPVPPRTLNPEVPRDLETICLKCLCKDPAWRYASAQALAEDLRRFCEDLPLLGRPVGRLLHTWIWCRRNPLVAGLIGSLALSWLLGTGAAVSLALRASQQAVRADDLAKIAVEQKGRADQLADEARTNAQRVWDNAYVADLRHVRQALAENLVGMARELLEGQLPARTDSVDRRSFEWYYWWQFCRPNAKPAVPGLPVLASASQLCRTYMLHDKEVYDLCFSPDGLTVATASGDQTVCLWDPASGSVLHRLHGHTGPVLGVCFSPDGRRLASASEDKTVKLWDALTGQELATLRGHPGAVTCVRFSPDGRWLASCGWYHSIRLWDAVSGQVIRERENHRGPVTRLDFSPDRQHLASASNDQTVRIWDILTGDEEQTLQGHTLEVLGVCYSPDGKLLASCGSDQTLKVWDVDHGSPLLSIKDYAGSLNGITFSPDGKRLATAGADGTVKVWDVTTGQELLSLKEHATDVRCVGFSADGQRLAAGASTGLVKVWQAPSKR